MQHMIPLNERLIHSVYIHRYNRQIKAKVNKLILVWGGGVEGEGWRGYSRFGIEVLNVYRAFCF
jgi:hypothetical protein